MKTLPEYRPTAYKLYMRFVMSFFLLPAILFSQTTTNISGVVNSYYQVTEVMPTIYALKVSNPAGLSVNNRVLIIQMKGVSINPANSSSFGDTTALAEAGNYETAVICKIKTDTIYFHHTFLNTYSPVSGKVQMVKMAEYYSANVTDTVKALSWNSTSGTGGVIAIFCDMNITLNAPVYADSSGYRGGAYVFSTGDCFNFPLAATGYIYNPTSTSPQSGAWKGEGAATLITSQSGGRGSPANGGGGGNNHNNSGGGGANLNGGGIGGGNSSSDGCTTTLRGLAGKALSSWNGQKIFFGGGGGAGHSNGSTFTKGGGNGGGIIFIHAENIIGNGYKVSANGGNGGQSLSDGAGGGGAGGTIIADITNFTGVTIQANGGNGGNADDGGTVDRCYGGGGGGSGGVIYFPATTPAITANSNGGNAGTETGRHSGCLAAVAAGAGSNGQIIQNYFYKRSTNPASNCGIALPFKFYYFIAKAEQQKVLLEWRITGAESINHFIIEKQISNNNWVTIQTITASRFLEIYNAEDLFPSTGKNYYRIKIIENDNKQTYSSIRWVDFSSIINEFSVYPNPAQHTITISRNNPVPVNLKLLSLSGNLILQKQLTTAQTTIQLPLLARGIYILQLEGINKKLIIH